MSCARYFNPVLRARILRGDAIPWLLVHPRRSYIVACVIAAVPWPGERDAIAALRDVARQMTTATGTRHVLDHIIPLNHLYVCGLHVSANLRPVPWAVNASKGNRFNPDQRDFFYA